MRNDTQGLKGLKLVLSKLHSRSAATAKWPGTCYYKVPDSSPFIRKLSTVATKKDSLFFFLFFSFLFILTPTLVIPVQSLLVVRNAPNTKPLTSISESDVNNSQRIGFDSVK